MPSQLAIGSVNDLVMIGRRRIRRASPRPEFSDTGRRLDENERSHGCRQVGDVTLRAIRSQKEREPCKD